MDESSHEKLDAGQAKPCRTDSGSRFAVVQKLQIFFLAE
jgi:hypothetical protein